MWTDRQTDIVTYRAAIAANNRYSNIIDLNNRNNNHSLITAIHFHKTHYGQTDQQADIVTYRAAIKAENAKYDYRMI